MVENFKGKTALVTGAGKGIGRAVAIALMKAGALTVAISRTEDDLDSLSKEVPGIITINLDVSNWDKVREAIENLGVVDLLVNNAGTATLLPFVETKLSDIDEQFDVNYKAVFNISQVVSKKLMDSKRPGSIVNISSLASKLGIEDHAVYCSSKAAVDSLTKVMALELGKHNIRVNCVNPTVCLTELGRKAWSDPTKSKPMLDRIPIGRFIEVGEVVEATLFLLSDKAASITGQCLLLDGGLSTH